MNEPSFEHVGNVFRLTWEEDQVMAEMRRVADRDYGPGGEVTWFSIALGQRGLLHQGFLGLTSTRGKDSLASALDRRQSGKDWSTKVEQLSILVLRSLRQGAPVTVLWTNDQERVRPQSAIRPLVFRGHPYVLFGEPSAAKSYLALLLTGIAVGRGIEVPPFSCPNQMKALYLDWETDEADQAFRLSRIEKGFGQSLGGLIAYRRCSAPLAIDIERVQEIVMDRGVDLVIIDSLGPAAGGDLNSAQSAQEFFGALRTLGCTSLSLAHVAKNTDPGRRSIYGSQFFNALARGTAEVKRFQEAGEDEISVGIYPRKSNLSRLERPIGLRIRFDGDDGPVVVLPQDLRDVPSLASNLSVGARITDALMSGSRRLGPKELAELIDANPSTVRKELQRLAERGKVALFEDGYGALTPEEDHAPF